jgi:hypothetical protein
LILSFDSGTAVDGIIGGDVISVVVEVVEVLSGCFFESVGLAKIPAEATVSFPMDLRFLASIGDSDLLKAPAVHMEKKKLLMSQHSPKKCYRFYLTCGENTQDNDSCNKSNTHYPA